MRELRLGLGLTKLPINATAFTPASISNLLLFIDPSDLTTMRQTGTRASPGTAVAADADPVGLILDKSGANNDFGQATTTKRPLYKTSGGLSWLQTDGVDDFLASLATIDLSAYGQLGVAIAFTPTSTANGTVCEFGPQTGSNNGTFYPAWANDPTAAKISAGCRSTLVDDVNTVSASYGSGVTSLVSYQSLDITQALAASKLPMRINGATVATTTSSETGPAGTVFSTQTMYLGSRAGTSAFCPMKIYGLIIKGGAFTAPELAKVETWLGAKAGLTL